MNGDGRATPSGGISNQNCIKFNFWDLKCRLLFTLFTPIHQRGGSSDPRGAVGGCDRQYQVFSNVVCPLELMGKCLW